MELEMHFDNITYKTHFTYLNEDYHTNSMIQQLLDLGYDIDGVQKILDLPNDEDIVKVLDQWVKNKMKWTILERLSNRIENGR